MALDTNFRSRLNVTALDAGSARSLEQAVRFHGIRNVLHALEQICDYHAEKSTELFNTVQAKQHAAWSVAIAALRDNRKLTDPGRE